MSRNLIAQSGDQEIDRKSTQSWKSFGYWGAIVVWVGLFWFFLYLTPSQKVLAPIYDLLIFSGGAVILSFLLSHALSTSGINPDQKSRLAFLLSFGVGILLTGLLFAFGRNTRPGSDQIWIGLLLISTGLIGSFLGCLIFTARESGLWENNSPPPEAVRQKVYELHQKRIGRLDPVPFGKRSFDLLLSVFGLILTAPVWFITLFLIWFEDPGPIFFVKNSVGIGGVNFQQLKFRTMIAGAEEGTGPVLASEEDDRILRSGKWLRKTALDELPQLLNILRGEMSFVGPRPQRTVLVYDYLLVLPEYADRHRVLPGLSGLAQVAGDYYLTPRQKLRFDRLYIRHCSLGFDIRLILLAFFITFWYRWQPGWKGRLPRRLLHR